MSAAKEISATLSSNRELKKIKRGVRSVLGCLLWWSVAACAAPCADWKELGYVLLMDARNTPQSNIRYPDDHYAVNLRYLGDVESGTQPLKKSSFMALSPLPDGSTPNTPITLEWEPTNCWWTQFDYARAKVAGYRPLQVGEAVAVFLRQKERQWVRLDSFVNAPISLSALHELNQQLTTRAGKEKQAGYLFWLLLGLPVLLWWLVEKRVPVWIKLTLAVLWPLLFFWRSSALSNYYTAQAVEYGLLLPFFCLWCVAIYRGLIRPKRRTTTASIE